MGLTIWLIITVILIVVEIITLGLTSIWCICGRTDLADRCTLVGAASCVCGCVDVAFCVYPAICGEASDEECGEDECRQSDWKRRNRQAGDQQSGGTGCCEAFGHGMVCTFRR